MTLKNILAFKVALIIATIQVCLGLALDYNAGLIFKVLIVIGLGFTVVGGLIDCESSKIKLILIATQFLYLVQMIYFIALLLFHNVFYIPIMQQM